MSRSKGIIAPDGTKLTPKEERVVKFMNKHKSISPMQAETELHDHRLAASIHLLRKRGYEIDTVRVDITNAYGEPAWYGKYVYHKEH